MLSVVLPSVSPLRGKTERETRGGFGLTSPSSVLTHQVSPTACRNLQMSPGEAAEKKTFHITPKCYEQPRQLTISEALWHNIRDNILGAEEKNAVLGLHIIGDIQPSVCFTSDDVRLLWGLRGYLPPTRGFWGALICAAQKKGLIKVSGRRVKSSFLRSHARTIQEWVKT